MKLLIAYDGSDCSELALNDLVHAGLPEECEAVVLSVADIILPEEEDVSALHPMIRNRIERSREHAHQVVREAQAHAERGAERVREMFPGWKVEAVSQADSPAWAVVTTVEKINIDLVVVGSHGYGFFNRARLGSISESVLNQSRCSVRVVKKADHETHNPLRIVLGYDGSSDAQQTMRALAGRNYPKGTIVNVVSVIDMRMISALSYLSVFTEEMLAITKDDDAALIRYMADEAAKFLLEAGFECTTTVLEGDPKKEIVKFAETWKADQIFVGAHGTTKAERFLMGSVSTSVVSRAHCTVEVVRP